MTNSAEKKWSCAELPVVEYRPIMDLQREFVGARHNEILSNNIILLLEHFPVFTLGRRGGLNSLKTSRVFLEKTKIPIIRTERGGSITFHGPGQIVIYPIVDLRNAGMQVLDYVNGLEEIMIQVAGEWGLRAERSPVNRGIWVGNNKIGSIGIAVQRGICFHGFALNVNISLKPFGWINPCGLENRGVTSIKREISRKVDMALVRGSVKRHIEICFGVELISTDLQELQSLTLNDRKQSGKNIICA